IPILHDFCIKIFAFTVKFAAKPRGSNTDIIRDRASRFVGTSEPSKISGLVLGKVVLKENVSSVGFHIKPRTRSVPRISFQVNEFWDLDRRSSGIALMSSGELLIQLQMWNPPCL